MPDKNNIGQTSDKTDTQEAVNQKSLFELWEEITKDNPVQMIEVKEPYVLNYHINYPEH
jgi:hypothetical protein